MARFDIQLGAIDEIVFDRHDLANFQSGRKTR